MGVRVFQILRLRQKSQLVNQELQPLLKRNWAHKHYSARLTQWLCILSHFDVNVQYTAGKNRLCEIPRMNYLSRH